MWTGRPTKYSLHCCRSVPAATAAVHHPPPRTVVPAEAGHLARGQVQVHPVERLHRPEVLLDAPQLQQGFCPVPAAARALRGLVHLSHLEDPLVALPGSGSRRSGISAPQSIAARLPPPFPAGPGSAQPPRQAGVGGPALPAGPPTPAVEERSTGTPVEVAPLR